MTLDLSQRIHGALAGMVVGEAIGAPFRKLKPGHVRQVYGELAGYVDSDVIHAAKPHRWLPAGMHTAPAQLALAMCDALFIGSDPREAFELLLHRMAGEQDYPFGCLRNVDHDLAVLVKTIRQERVPALTAHDPTSAIAVSPLALYAASTQSPLDHAQVLKCARLFSEEPFSMVTSIALAEALYMTLQGEFDSPNSLVASYRELASRVASFEETLGVDDTSVSSIIGLLPGLTREDDETLARKSIVAESRRLLDNPAFDDPQQPFPPANLTWALYLSFRQRKFDQPILNAAEGGRESNAISAMCGLLCGARLGPESIPSAWLDGLVARPLVGSRIKALVQNDPSHIYEADLLELEKSWTDLVERGRSDRVRKLEDQERKHSEKHPKKPMKPSTVQPPPSTYARRNPPLDVPPIEMDPEEVKKAKAQRSRKRIDWKEDRRKERRKRE